MSDSLPERAARVLVVDDETIMQDVMSDILGESGYNVDIAENGQVALEKTETVEYDMVFADIRMPVMDGIQFLRLLKERNPDLSIVMMTGYASVDVAVEAMKLGAFDFVTKPFNLEHIRIVAARAIEQQKLRKLRKACDDLGCRVEHAFGVLSFLSLPVIPELRLTDKGLVDVGKFKIVSLFE